MFSRLIALMLACSMMAPVLGCGKPSPPPPVDDTRTTQGQMNTPEPAVTGMKTGTKVILLAGAAAAYYLYKKHQNVSAASGPESQYYLSKNGRVYYRDAEHRAHWITPPAGGISVPESEANDYRQFEGYSGRADGRDLAGLGNDSND